MKALVKYGLLIACVALCCFWGQAATTKTVTVEMTRSSKEAAIDAALKEAVARVNGRVVRVDNEDNVYAEENDGGLSTHKTSVDKNRNVSRGVVKGYDVKSSKKEEDGSWTVVLIAEVMIYESPLGMGRKKKLAVMPFRYGIVGFQVGGDTPDKMKPAEMVAQEISGAMTKAYTQSGTYNVLSRFGLTEMEKEEQLIKEMAPAHEYVKVGQRLGADFLVVGYVRDLYVAAPVTRTSPLTGKTKTSIPKAYLRVAYRRLVVSTAEIAAMEDIDIELDPKALAGCQGRPDLAYETLIKQLQERASINIDASLLPGGGSALKIPAIGAP